MVPAVEGDLSSISVPELFRAIAYEQRTGCLLLSRPGTDRNRDASIWFLKGNPYHAALRGSGVRLGTRLVSAGLITRDDVNEALTVQATERSRRRLGEILIDRLLIPRAQLERIVKQQIEDVIFETLRWNEGAFLFEPRGMSEEDVGLKMSADDLLIEGARRFREWHRITRRIPTLDAVPHVSDAEDGPVEVVLSAEEWAFVSRVDGRKTAAELATVCGFTDLEAARALFGLVTAGVLIIDLPPGVELLPKDPELEAAFEELERAIEETATGTGAWGPSRKTLEDLVHGAAGGSPGEGAVEEHPEAEATLEREPVGDGAAPESGEALEESMASEPAGMDLLESSAAEVLAPDVGAGAAGIPQPEEQREALEASREAPTEEALGVAGQEGLPEEPLEPERAVEPEQTAAVEQAMPEAAEPQNAAVAGRPAPEEPMEPHSPPEEAVAVEQAKAVEGRLRGRGDRRSRSRRLRRARAAVEAAARGEAASEQSQLAEAAAVEEAAAVGEVYSGATPEEAEAEEAAAAEAREVEEAEGAGAEEAAAAALEEVEDAEGAGAAAVEAPPEEAGPEEAVAAAEPEEAVSAVEAPPEEAGPEEAVAAAQPEEAVSAVGVPHEGAGPEEAVAAAQPEEAVSAVEAPPEEAGPEEAVAAAEPEEAVSAVGASPEEAGPEEAVAAAEPEEAVSAVGVPPEEAGPEEAVAAAQPEEAGPVEALEPEPGGEPQEVSPPHVTAEPGASQSAPVEEDEPARAADQPDVAAGTPSPKDDEFPEVLLSDEISLDLPGFDELPVIDDARRSRPALPRQGAGADGDPASFPVGGPRGDADVAEPPVPLADSGQAGGPGDGRAPVGGTERPEAPAHSSPEPPIPPEGRTLEQVAYDSSYLEEIAQAAAGYHSDAEEVSRIQDVWRTLAPSEDEHERDEAPPHVPIDDAGSLMDERTHIDIGAGPHAEATQQPDPEEPGALHSEFGSVARLFADLTKPAEELDTKPLRHPARWRKPPPPTSEERPDDRSGASAERRPVDPSVDTTALIREFSALGFEEESPPPPAPPPHGHEKRRADRQDEERGRGRFGKRRR